MKPESAQVHPSPTGKPPHASMTLPGGIQATGDVLGQIHGQARTREAWQKAAALTPRGVMSNYRYWGDHETMMIAGGKGSRLWDVDGNQYIDYRSGFGAIILGHGFDPVCDAVNEAVRFGSVFTMSTPWETRAAERFVRMCPCVEQVRFCNSGTEATMHAVRLARAFTGRELLVKFEGNFHGVHDYLLFSTAGGTPEKMGDRKHPVPQAMSKGIPASMQELVITLPVNDREVLERTLTEHGHRIAAIIAEPVLGNAASLVPDPGWFDFIRSQCDQHGILFVLDEVKTGFRIAPGGAQQVYGIKPDLATYAKALGSGFPIAAFGGRRDIMDLIGPGSMTHGGTFNGNVVAMAAADKIMEILEDGSMLAQVGARGKALSEGISGMLKDAGIPHEIMGPPQMWGLVLGEGPFKDFRDVLASDRDLYHRLTAELIRRGVLPEPDVREPWFMNYGHTEQDIALSLEIFAAALKTVKG